jgi:hypothetical protein
VCACAIARAVGKPRDWQQRRRASYLAPSLLGSIASRGDSIALTQVEMESSNQQDTDNSATSQGAAASGGEGFTEAQLAAISAVVQGLLDKALSKDRPASGDGSSTARGDSSRKSGELRARENGRGS